MNIPEQNTIVPGNRIELRHECFMIHATTMREDNKGAIRPSSKPIM
jgi:hypothetical protein